jgi:hypothetical protein
MKTVAAILSVALAVSAAGCEASALRYAKKKNPGCDVTQVAETKNSVRVVVRCPNADPFERVYREQ